MQVTTQLLIEDIAKWVTIVGVVSLMLYATSRDEDVEDTDFPKQDNTIEVHIKQFGRADIVVYKDCVMLAQKVEC